MQFVSHCYTVVSCQPILRHSVYKKSAVYLSGTRVRFFLEIRDLGSPTIIFAESCDIAAFTPLVFCIFDSHQTVISVPLAPIVLHVPMAPTVEVKNNHYQEPEQSKPKPVLEIMEITNKHSVNRVSSSSVGKQSPCLLSFVYTSYIRYGVRPAPKFGNTHRYFHIIKTKNTYMLSYAA